MILLRRHRSRGETPIPFIRLTRSPLRQHADLVQPARLVALVCRPGSFPTGSPGDSQPLDQCSPAGFFRLVSIPSRAAVSWNLGCSGVPMKSLRVKAYTGNQRIRRRRKLHRLLPLTRSYRRRCLRRCHHREGALRPLLASRPRRWTPPHTREPFVV